MKVPLGTLIVGAAVHVLGRHPWDFYGTLVAIGGTIWIVELALRGELFEEPAAEEDPYDFLDSDVFKK